jgi:hypothetical protein
VERVIARTEVIEREEDDWPAWLADHYEERYHGAWEEELEAYCVMPKLHPRTGLPQERSRARPLARGPGHALWPLAAAPIRREQRVLGSMLSVRYPEATPGEGADPPAKT